MNIGIDPGRNNGYAEYDPDSGRLTKLLTIKSLAALFEQIEQAWLDYGGNVYFVVEDARMRSGFDHRRLQGVGSVRGICREIEAYLSRHKFPYQMVRPLSGAAKSTKRDPVLFSRITGYKGRTSEHSRDAAMLVFQRNTYINEKIMRKNLHM